MNINIAFHYAAVSVLAKFINPAKEFLKDDFNKALLAIVLLIGIAAFLYQPAAAVHPPEPSGNSTFIHFFYLSTCPHCHVQMEKLHPRLESEYGVEIAYHEASAPGTRELFESVCDKRGLAGHVPTTLVGNRTFVGYSDAIGAQIEAAVKECIAANCTDPLVEMGCIEAEKQQVFTLPVIGEIDGRTYSLPLLAVSLGLIDGFNPCAMWVLVYLISLVMMMNDRKRIFLVVGSFVLASGILYFLFMSAWLNAFLLVGYLRPVSLLIGMIALFGAATSIREFVESGKKGVECKVGDAQSHAKMASDAKRIATAPFTLGLLASIIALAFVVNSVEFVCSSAIPAVFTQVLALRGLSTLEYYGYILLYVLFFMLDDLVIFGLAAFTVSGGLGDKYARYCKLIGGAIMLILGIMLLFFPKALS